MAAKDHRATVVRLFDEVWNGRSIDAIEELYAPDFVADYRPYAPLRRGHDAVCQMVERAWATLAREFRRAGVPIRPRRGWHT